MSVASAERHQARYRAVKSRDRRFDGVFYTAVRTTGIYCRPSCPAITPKIHNVEFFVTAAAAQRAGYRACKRCVPDASPGSPAWDRRGDTVARAIRLIDDGVVDRDGVDGVAQRLGYSPRHLHRLLVGEVGAGPVALARARRAHNARVLVHATDLPYTEIAYAAGFGSIRQFNDTMRAVYDATPTELRARHRRSAHRGQQCVDHGEIAMHLPARAPFAVDELFSFLAARAVVGVEWVGDGRYERSLDLPHGHGIVALEPADGGIAATFRLRDIRDLTPAVRRVRRLCDLDADPVAIDDVVGVGMLAPLVAAIPGLRAPGSVDPWETIVRTVVGQQVSVAGARTVTARIVSAFGAPLSLDHPHLSHVFVSASKLAALESSSPVVAMPRARADTLVRVARAVAEGRIDLHADRALVREQLLAVRGIGPWTADYVMMRALSDPDVMLDSDLVVRRQIERMSTKPRSTATVEASWSPWRTYATHHLWRAATDPAPVKQH